jgi:hypothetical protein
MDEDDGRAERQVDGGTVPDTRPPGKALLSSEHSDWQWRANGPRHEASGQGVDATGTHGVTSAPHSPRHEAYGQGVDVDVIVHVLSRGQGPRHEASGQGVDSPNQKR